MTSAAFAGQEAVAPRPADIRSNHRRVDLDFVRGIAILLAVGSHFNQHDTGYHLLDLALLPGRVIGWAGVDLFFVLSGFLVGGLIFREMHLTGAFDARRFLIRRAFKIWPVLYFYIALVVVTGRYHWSEVIPQTLFHVQNYFRTPLSHLWSLAVEEHFYLTAALLLGPIARARRGLLGNLPRLLFGIALAAFLLRLVGKLNGFDAITLQTQSQFRFDALACGLLLAYLSVFHKAAFAGLAAAKPVAAAIVLAGTVLLFRMADRPELIATFGYTITYITGGAFLLLAYDAPAVNDNRIAGFMAWIGTYSYPMYVLQFVPFRLTEAVWKRISDSPMTPIQELVAHYAGALLIAIVTAKLLERPMLRLRNRLFPSVA